VTAMSPTTHHICVIEGDGIGPEVIGAGVRVLEALPLAFSFSQARAGYRCYQETGTPLPEETVLACQEADAILFGAVTTPPAIPGYFSPIIRLRKVLDLYANVRPIYSLPLTSSRQGIDFTIVRENTEDLYCGRERAIEGGAIAERLITRKACERILEFAFQMAECERRPSMTVVHKANVLRLTDGLFLEEAQKAAARHPGVAMETALVDSCAMRLILQPESFHLMVTTNMFGDILSDEAAALVGGLGVAASGNLGTSRGLFEPVHGSAPDLAGKGLANPVASILAIEMMLRFLEETESAHTLHRAVLDTLREGCTTPDLGGKSNTAEVTEAVIDHFRRSSC
jgi:homoisocitrate dehydrogenase